MAEVVVGPSVCPECGCPHVVEGVDSHSIGAGLSQHCVVFRYEPPPSLRLLERCATEGWDVYFERVERGADPAFWTVQVVPGGHAGDWFERAASVEAAADGVLRVLPARRAS